MLKIVNVLMVMLLTVSACNAEVENTPDIVVENGVVKIFGHVVDVKKPIVLSTPKKESDTPIYFYRSKDNRITVVQIFEGVDAEFWLYNPVTEKELQKIQIEPGDNVRVSWYKNKLIEISWGGMGYSISKFVNSTNAKVIKTIEDLLLYNLENDTYVSFYLDGVEVGNVIENRCKPKRYDLNIKYVSVQNAIFSIEDTAIVDNKIEVKYTSENGSLKIKKISINNCE